MEKTVTQILSLGRSPSKSENPKFSRQKFFKIGLICIAVFIITLFHYATAPDAGISHVIFRELYFLPIILGAFWFGLRGGLITALTISVLYGPLVLLGPGKLSPHDLGNIMEVFLFNLVGGLLGWLKDREDVQQARLRETENLAAVGRATAMIAHDLKTPLITIAGLARRLTGKITPESPEGEKILIIQEQAERLEKLVMDKLFYSKPLQLEMKSENIFSLLTEARKTVNGISESKKVIIDLPADNSSTCRMDSEKMLLVFVNLLTNAVEASLPGKSVEVSLQNHAEEVTIKITDRGIGIPETLKEKIFEPFVSSKNKGTGLGLPICRKIVESHRGTLEWRNNPSGGTIFTIRLPKTQ